ncbi:MAG: hypothetical protein HF976_03990 [ANME-2 cluster archaeon]|nr:hypothetical protein [ANME-2 cluster archaeon]MBC2709288.1 hypothetical protein [ANME-2 cluster archaeon]MBC2747336.1 hypothetical protein [ANME-2 cluster archaeon]
MRRKLDLTKILPTVGFSMPSFLWNAGSEGVLKKRFEELDGYVRARLRSFRVKKRTWKVILYTLQKPKLREWVLFHLVHYLNSPSPAMGLSKRKPLTRNLYELFDEEGEAVRPLLYSRPTFDFYQAQ